ncbi:glycosyltransferase family 2 protein [Sphingobacterium bovistauri]|uniref:Glycosyltransferase n=1 Tax=Sphingobacterium bovistauri TaxID=2781959 RepID=A0ABS7Z1R3_9SPHI|nr:glycosyltransferase family 2 protein [Sphingobacterium bovistauri]MCA5004116.1 glycosyltransferase [Sphingobacterium bovistauri]
MKLSIVTINYNNCKGLQDTFESVKNQFFHDFEYIVIDGGSSDGSKEIIESNSQIINYWVSEKDRGIYHAMNKGILASNGEYLLFLNSGDTLYNNKVLEEVNSLLAEDDIISGNMVSLKSNGIIENISSPKEMTFEVMYFSSLSHPSTFIKKELFFSIGMYDEELKIVSDWKWFLYAKFLHNVSYRMIDNVISKFREDGISSDFNNQSRANLERQKTLQEFFKNYCNEGDFLINSLVNNEDTNLLIPMLKSRNEEFKKYFSIILSNYSKSTTTIYKYDDLERSRLFKIFMRLNIFLKSLKSTR